MEDLASHGFVVAAIDHPYNSQIIAFPDGRRMKSDDVPDIPEEVKKTLKFHFVENIDQVMHIALDAPVKTRKSAAKIGMKRG